MEAPAVPLRVWVLSEVKHVQTCGSRSRTRESLAGITHTQHCLRRFHSFGTASLFLPLSTGQVHAPSALSTVWGECPIQSNLGFTSSSLLLTL